eukprot:g2413.t1
MWSENCGNVALNVTVDAQLLNWKLLFRQAGSYAFAMCLVVVSHIYLLGKQMAFADTPALSAKLSLLTVGAQATLDAYLCLFHLVGGMLVVPLYSALAMVAFFQLLLFSVFEMRVLVHVWKARRPSGFNDGWLAMRRELSTLYSRFYCALILGLYGMYHLWSRPAVLLCALYSYWLPQITHNAVAEVRRPLLRVYLVGTTAVRLVLPLYFFGCPYNIVIALTGENTVDYSLCAMVVAWSVAQVVVLLLQDKLGPRFFLPRALRPVQYDYRRRVEGSEVGEGGEGAEVDCPICMSRVSTTTRGYMVTPCGHVFHDECLMQWMDVKMECPSCRAPLPVLSSDDQQVEIEIGTRQDRDLQV